MDNHESVMGGMAGLMGHMVAGLMVGIGQAGMIWSKVAGGWIHLTGEVVVMGSILVLLQRDNMVIIVIILIGAMEISSCQMSSRKTSLLHFMES